MKNTLSVLLTVLFLSTGSILFAQSINIETAKEIASKHLMSVSPRNLKSASTNENQLQVAFTSTANEDRDTLFYIVNDNTNNGFVIVASDKREWPILGYSTKGKYDSDNLPPAFIEWMEGMKNEIAYIKANNIQADPKISQEWNKLSSKNPYTTNGASSVGPLLQTEWAQGSYYNGLCPADASGQDGRALTGCVATSMAQIMKYWNFPTIGTGSHSYNHSSYGDLSANFGSTTYQWSQMPNSVNSENNAVATLMYHCGVSVDMNYGPSSSGAHLSEEAMVNYFNYSSKLRYVYKSNYSTNDWEDLMKSELNAKRPIYYRGSGSGGHAFVCDGYNGTNQFHFNWGWGGYADGYFYLGGLNPAGDDYNSDQAAVIGIFPTSLPAGYNGFFLSDNTINVSANNVSDSLTITSSVNWNALSSESWLTLSTSTGVSGTSTLTLTAAENNTGSVRSANITISAGTYNNQIVTVYQNKKTAVTAGNLNTVLAGVLTTTSNLTLTGTIDARDFKTMRDSMTLLAKVDLSLVTIDAYEGTLGTASTNNTIYPENGIPTLALFDKKNLTSVGLPQSTTSIGFQALDYCTRLTTVTIPSSVTSIKSYALNHCTGLQSIVTQKPTPVDLSSSTNVFLNVDKTTCKLYVPFGSAALYAAADQWKDFTSIIEMPGIYPNSNSLVFSSKSATEKLKITSSVAWTATSNQSWLSVSPASGTMGSDSISLTVDANNTTSKRTAKVTVSAAGFDDQIIDITQYGLIEVTAGNLNTVLAGVLTTTSNLALIGTIDARDFKTMKDSMPALEKVDLSLVNIVAYTGTLGTASTNNTIYPENEIPKLALFDKYSLTSLDLPKSATSIGFQAVDYCTGLTTLTIPSSVTSIRGHALNHCTGLQSIVSQKPTPIDLSSSADVFLKVNKTTCKLYVPYGSAALYAAANQWKDFTNILELPGFSLARTTSTIGAKQNSSDSIKINSNTTWTAASDQLWLVVEPENGSGNDTLVFTAEANPLSISRIAKLTVAAVGATSQIITVTQEAGDILLSVSSTVKNIAKEAGSKDSVFVTSNTSWTAASDQLWLVLEPENGSGNDTLVFTAEANLLSTARIAKVTVAAVGATSQIITVTQEAGDILLSVSSTVKNIAKEAGSKDSVFVTSNTSWTATSDQSWLVVDPENGSGNDTLAFTAEENHTIATREAIITVSANGIASQIITLTQEAGDILLSVSSIVENIAKEAGSKDSVFVTSNTSWTATSDQSWLVLDPENGSGNDTLVFTAEENLLSTARIAKVTVEAVGATSQIITVTQEAGDILLSVSSTVKNIAKEAGSKDSVFVTSNTSWTATSDQSWLVLDPENGSGNDTLIFTAEANLLSTARIAKLTVAAVGATSQIITVTQEAGDILLSVSSTVKNIAKEAGSKDSVFVTSNTSWTATSDQSWLVVDPENGSGNDTLVFTAEENLLSTARIAKLTVEAVGATSQIITVTQEAGDILLSVSSTVKNIAKEAGSKDSVFVTSNTSWTANSDQLWLVLEPENDSGNDMLVFTAEANPLSTARIANITVAAVGATSQIITVTQEAGSAISDNFELDNTTISNGESTCFNAYLNITVAGNSAVIFENGSSVNLIAGQSVRFLPGFHAQSGSFMNASITLNNSFCDSRIPISSPIVTQPEKKNLKNERIIKEQTILKAEKSIKVYPNPNNGNFTIELTNFDSNADVYVYNMLGAMVYKSSIENQSNLNINLPEINKGLYFVKVIGENEQFTKKIVVN